MKYTTARPRRTSGHSASVGARLDQHPLRLSQSPRNGRWSRSSMPRRLSVIATTWTIFASTSAPARAFISASAASGRSCKRSFIQNFPEKTTAPIRSCWSAVSTAPASLTRAGIVRSAWSVTPGASPKVNATTRHPWRRASPAMRAGSTPAPHIKPSERSTECCSSTPPRSGRPGSFARSREPWRAIAHPRPRPARGDERDRAGLEADLHVGDVGRGGMDGGPHRGEPPGRRVDEPQHDVEVVDHQVHHHAVLLHARGEGPEPARLDEDRTLDDLLQLLHRAVEPLDVTDVQDGAALLGDREELARLLERRRDGLLDEDAHARLQEVGGDLEVLLGRHRHAREIDLVDQLAMVEQRLGVVVRCDLLRAVPIDVDDTGQVDVPELGVREHVVLPHVPGPDDAGAEPALLRGSGGHHTVSLSLGSASGAEAPG